jgi:hypothetical protein
MTNPVMQALLGARLQEEPSAFGKWCIVRGVRSLPAMPAHVACFISDLAAAEKSIKQIWPLVQEISQTHLSNNLADPTAGGLVGEVINSIALIERPRSWAKTEEERWKSLPYDMQVFLSHREQQRDTAVRRAQNEAADARKQLEAIQKPTEATNGIIEEQTHADA